MNVIERDRGGWLGKYDLIAELPQEDAEDVYLAASIAPGGHTKLAVIRTLRPTPGADGSLVLRFLEAGRLGAQLKHANIVETYEVAPAPDGNPGEIYVSSEYLEGQTLARIIERVGPKELGRGMWLRVLVDALAGLHHAHEARDDAGAPLHLAHLRLAPGRILVTYEGQVKVLDFGKLDVEETTSPSRSLARRARSLAPEQARGERADRRADVFAVGTMLWEASTRVPLWGELDGRAILAELASGRIPSLRAVDPAVPAPLADIVGRALAPDPEDRYSTAMHLQTDLEGFLRASGESAAPRDIGRVVAHAFLEERLRTTTIVDEQLRRLRARARATGEAADQPVSLLRIESDPPGASRERLRNAPTSPRPFIPVSVPPGSPRAARPARSSAPRTSPRLLAWIVGAAALLAILAALAVANAR